MNPVSDPVGPRECSYRVLGVGSWDLGPAVCHSASRSWNTPSLQFHAVGLRIAMSFSEITKQNDAGQGSTAYCYWVIRWKRYHCNSRKSANI